jgi:hypothetical protein
MRSKSLKITNKNELSKISKKKFKLIIIIIFLFCLFINSNETFLNKIYHKPGSFIYEYNLYRNYYLSYLIIPEYDKNKQILNIFLIIVKIIFNEILIYILMIIVDVYLIYNIRSIFKIKINKIKSLKLYNNSNESKIKDLENKEFKKTLLIFLNLFISFVFKTIIVYLNVFFILNSMFIDKNLLSDFLSVFVSNPKLGESVLEFVSLTYILYYIYSIVFYTYLDTNFKTHLKEFFSFKK